MSKLKIKKRIKHFFEDFKQFALKGNVVDMAIGVIIGSAFSKIVSSLVADIITPLISYLTGKQNFSDMAFTLKTFPDGTKLLLKYGTLLQTSVDFIIIALTIFVVIKIFTNANKRSSMLLNNIIGGKKHKKSKNKESEQILQEPIEIKETELDLLKKILIQLEKNNEKETLDFE